jgi:hypothetical protein
MTLEQKYTIPGVHHDQFNIDLGGGKPDGPGPGHYRLERHAFLGAADWMWVFAGANETRREVVRDYEGTVRTGGVSGMRSAFGLKLR